MKHPMKTGLLAFATLALSGCSLFRGHSAMDGDKRAAQLAVAQVPGSYFTQLGRRELDVGRPGIALEAFERALAAGEEAAPALNGMGVVYARLGKYDAAHRLFSEAAAHDPANEKYAANLTRLTSSPTFAMRHEADAAVELVQAAATLAAEPAQASAAPVPAPASQPTGRLVRVGPGEFRIHSAAPQNAPSRTALNAVDPRFKPQVSVNLIAGQATAAQPIQAATITSINTRPRVANITGFKPEVRVNLAPSGKTGRQTGKEARIGN